MKKIILSTILGVFTTALMAQNDTVSMGASYANNKWYSLTNGEQGSQPANNWDLGFSTGSFESSLIFNESIASLYVIPGSTPATFSSADTAGLSTWDKLYNSDTTWEYGAFNRPASGSFDYGYGTYNMANHNIDGNRVFAIKYTNGTCKKLYIQLNYLGSGLGYDVVVVSANIDNSDEQTYTFNKLAYTGKNFVYYSVLNNTHIDREPATSDWDLLMTKYVAANYGTAVNQLVTGVLQNKGVKVAEARNIGDKETYTDYSAHEFQSNISTIGEDWKALDYSAPGFPFVVKDSLVYFVKAKDGDIYKVIFRGFIGSSAGSFIFTKEKLSGTGFFNAKKENVATLAIYPNPNSNGTLTIVYNFEKPENTIGLTISDLYGKVVFQQEYQNGNGLQQELVSTSNLAKGVYIVSIRSGNQHAQQKLIIN